jgi:hypothetical protein
MCFYEGKPGTFIERGRKRDHRCRGVAHMGDPAFNQVGSELLY